MLRPTSEPDFQEDLKALGGLVVQIMEPAILTVNPPRQQLEGLHEDSEDLVDFLQKIVFSTCKDLLEVCKTRTGANLNDSLGTELFLARLP